MIGGCASPMWSPPRRPSPPRAPGPPSATAIAELLTGGWPRTRSRRRSGSSSARRGRGRPGWGGTRSRRSAPPPATEPSLTVGDVDRVIERAAHDHRRRVGRRPTRTCCGRSWTRQPAEADFFFQLIERRAPPGRARGRHGRRGRQGRRGARDGRAPGGDARRSTSAARPRSRSPRAARPGGHRAHGLTADPADAGVDRRRVGRRARRHRRRARVGGVEARRRPHPGAPRRRRGTRSSPVASTRSPTPSPTSSPSPDRCQPTGWCSTARCCTCWPTTDRPASRTR